MKIVKKNQMKIVIFSAVKNRCMLHGRVCVMKEVVGSNPKSIFCLFVFCVCLCVCVSDLFIYFQILST